VVSERPNPGALPPGAERWWFLGAQGAGLVVGLFCAEVLGWPRGLLLILAVALLPPAVVLVRRLRRSRL
jgi:hypothetical protein